MLFQVRKEGLTISGTPDRFPCPIARVQMNAPVMPAGPSSIIQKLFMFLIYSHFLAIWQQ